jgi:hypothetical protein
VGGGTRGQFDPFSLFEDEGFASFQTDDLDPPVHGADLDLRVCHRAGDGRVDGRHPVTVRVDSANTGRTFKNLTVS